MGEIYMWLKRRSKSKIQDYKTTHTKLKSSQQMDTLIGAGTVVAGNLKFTGGLHIDGEVHGNISCEPQASALLIVGKNAKIRGDVKVPRAVINGMIIGKLNVYEHLELGENAIIQGDVHYNLLEMSVGAEVRGSLIPDSKHEPRMLEDHTNRERDINADMHTHTPEEVV